MASFTGKRPSPSSDPPQKKKARLFASQDEEGIPQTGAKIDPTYGQRGAFPGLDGDGEDEVFYGPADDGLAYLKMVRLEARGVPNLLVAPRADDITDGETEEDLYAPYKTRGEGWYADGAYTAAPNAAAAEEADDDEDQDPQAAYYTALLDRFENLRSTLSSSPHAAARPLEATVRSLPFDPTSRHWKHALLKSMPTPLLLSSLPQESVIVGVEELEALFTEKNLQGGLRHRLGAWAWGLLGRCRDVGDMISEDVSILRGLGKKACALSRRLQAGSTAAKDDVELAEFGHEGEVNIDTAEGTDIEKTDTHVEVDAEASDNSLENARKDLLAVLASDGIGKDMNEGDRVIEEEKDRDLIMKQVSVIHATLDMIITIVGECYGQRDLLDSRLAWEEL